MYPRLIKPPINKSFFLFAPRGTGKTTRVKTIFPKAVYLDLLEAELFNDLLANPQRLENFIPNRFTTLEKFKANGDLKPLPSSTQAVRKQSPLTGFNDWIIIDEIQRIPELLNEVHRLIEKNHYNFVLSGSRARKLKRKGPDLLAGRALTYFMHPLLYRVHPLTSKELGADFSLQRLLIYGYLPSVYSESSPKNILNVMLKHIFKKKSSKKG